MLQGFVYESRLCMIFVRPPCESGREGSQGYHGNRTMFYVSATVCLVRVKLFVGGHGCVFFNLGECMGEAAGRGNCETYSRSPTGSDVAGRVGGE